MILRESELRFVPKLTWIEGQLSNLTLKIKNLIELRAWLTPDVLNSDSDAELSLEAVLNFRDFFRSKTDIEVCVEELFVDNGDYGVSVLRDD